MVDVPTRAVGMKTLRLTSCVGVTVAFPKPHTRFNERLCMMNEKITDIHSETNENQHLPFWVLTKGLVVIPESWADQKASCASL